MTVTASASTREISADIAARWTANLDSAAKGLDLFDSEDRSSYRGRIFDLTASLRVDFVRGLAAHFGHPVAGNCDRLVAARALAAAGIERAQRAVVRNVRLTAPQIATLAWYAGREAQVRGGRVITERGTRTLGALFNHGLVDWSAPADGERDERGLRPLHVTQRGLAWLDGAGIVARKGA
jgi:hypothetical protein